MASSAQTSSAPSSLPSGITAPYAAINDSDTSGLIAILAAFALGLILISISVRIYARHNFRTYRADDYFFFVAAIFAIAEASTTFFGLTMGLGRGFHDKNVHYIALQKVRYACDLLYILTIFLSKCSTSFLFLNLTPGRGHHQAIWTAVGASVVWVFSATFVEAIRCHPQHPWTDTTTTCENSFARWIYIGVFDSIIEIGLFAISIYLVWGIQMSRKSKAIVVGAFSCRLPNIAAAVLRLYYLHMVLTYTDAHFWSTRVVSCTQFAIGYSIMASVVPYLKPFMMAYERPGTSEAAHYHHSGSTNSYKLSALSSKASKSEGGSTQHTSQVLETEVNDGFKNKPKSSIRMLRTSLGKLRPEQTKYQANAISNMDRIEPDKRGDDNSDDSQRMIIKKGMEWSVQYDNDSRRMSSVPSKATSSRYEDIV